MSEVTVTQCNKYGVYGENEDGEIMRIINTHQVPAVKVGDRIQGEYLHDEDGDDVYFEQFHNK